MSLANKENTASRLRVLVVDDSGFFRRRIVEILEGDAKLEVVGTAANGQEAVRQVLALKPDVVTMDIEMPVMDGITAVRRIMALRPTAVLMFSSLTYEGAQATLNALEAGALDFLPKRFDEFSRDKEEAKRTLRNRVRAIGLEGLRMQQAPAARPAPAPAPAPARMQPPVRRGDFRLVAIGSSTGGPVALQQVLSGLPAGFAVPILLIQHMPASFTPAFAERLNQQCRIQVKEAEDGEALQPGVAYLAPGGRQLAVESQGARVILRVYDDPAQHYRPCVDQAFSSVAAAFHARVLAIVLTGMGADGREGARKLKQGGASVWVQDEASCVIYGMPGAVAEAGLADEVLPLGQIGAHLASSV
ncbi:protein-glutamate methylesterase/protein-glutamine glutaminase [Thiohalobacter thiocyanaticus]|uniref:Protein-glutamate methylesterase/protein-glutamine glutaminase n=1 Tax=Thiohalobacter thiocyanaticus TaxID=585455 RepID=A0A426QGM1_9GAMM|nr:chemotaxis response regulator protein-glutamate methylesterase [Thiohalobacter thiocyanaticus]RRQ20894.1 chemotaxis response regulator protein-glutamate methylesterase [Thiohalobacter thiocyanaticus]